MSDPVSAPVPVPSSPSTPTISWPTAVVLLGVLALLGLLVGLDHSQAAAVVGALGAAATASLPALRARS